MLSRYPNDNITKPPLAGGGVASCGPRPVNPSMQPLKAPEAPLLPVRDVATNEQPADLPRLGHAQHPHRGRVNQ